MLGTMSIACYVAIQHGIEHPLGGLSLAAKSAAFHEIGRSLKFAPHADQSFRYIDIILNGFAALRMSDNHLVYPTLKFKNRALIFFELMRVESSSRNSLLLSKCR